MKKLLMVVLCLGMLTGCTKELEEMKLDYDQYLFEISDKNGNTDYLLGSFRMSENRIYEISPELEKAFLNADELVVEVNPLEVNLKMTQDQTYATTHPARNNVSKDLIEQLDSEPLLNRYDPTMYNAMTIHTLVTVTHGLEPRFLSLGATNSNSIDRYLSSKAMSFGKPIKEIEGVDEQINMIIKSSKLAPNYLIEQCLDLDVIQKNATIVREAYKNNDIKTLFNYLSRYESTHYQEEADLLKDYLLNSRNIDFYEKIIKYIADDQKQLILVGVVQLYGENGIIQQLKQNGYTVRCVKGA